MKYRFLLVVLVALLGLGFSLFGPACGSDDSTGTDGDNPYIPSGDTDNNSNTGGDPDNGNQSGDQEGGLVINPNLTDGDEEEEQDIWRPECTEDRDCSGDKYCDTTANICRWRKTLCEPCQSDRECGTRDDACLLHANGSKVCGKYCSADWPCLWRNEETDAFECQTVPDVSTDQCRYVGIAGTATKGEPCCVTDDCDPNTGEDLVCAGSPRACRKDCHSQGYSCPVGQVCRDDGACAPGCDTNGDCPEGQVCLEQNCVTGECAEHVDCYPERICNTTTLKCEDGCVESDGCLAMNECIDGECVERVGCKGTWDCDVNENCDKEDVPADAPPEDRGICYDPRYPSSDENPAPADHQNKLYCAPCTEQAQDSDECGGVGTHCLGVKDSEGVERGNFCFIPRDCKAMETDDDGNFVGWDDGAYFCPRGYDCMKMTGQITGKYCFTKCWDPNFTYPEELQQ